jgi:RNA polymerase sigma-70 factor (ECF subfamily)
MLAADREAAEKAMRAHWHAGDMKACATLLLESYGAEIFGFLMSQLRDETVVRDVFSQFNEDLWRGLEGFRWHCSARTWAYVLAGHAARRWVRDVQARRKRSVPLSDAGPLSAIAEKIRTATLPGARTDARERLAQLRESLPPEDQMVLVLRVNRKLGWKEIAQVMTYEGEVVANGVLEKEAARLRKRFQLAKEALRRLAVEQGLVARARDDDSER